MPFGTVKLNDGNEMPIIAFGTGTKWRGKDVTDATLQAIETGFSHLDSAQAYETEGFVGRAIHESGLSRSDLFITTKWSGPSSVSDAINTSLEELGVQQVDLYLVHFPTLLKDVERDWRAVEKIKEAGLAKSIGISNFNLKQLQDVLKVAKIKPAVNQIRFHPYTYAEHKELLKFSATHGIVTEAYSSLMPITRYPGGPVDKPVQAAAQRLGATPTQVLLLWARSKGVSIVTTSSTKAHLEEYLAVSELSPLTEDEIAAIDKAGAKGPPSLVIVRLRQNKWIVAAFVFLQLVFHLYRVLY